MNVSRYNELKAAGKIAFVGYIRTEEEERLKKVKAVFKRYDPETGAAVADKVVPLDIDNLEQQEAELEAGLDNVREFIKDAKATMNAQVIPGGVVKP